jgi:FKBP-type peptidyl-prolyl cis-trans isomerase (trigger factor)
MFEDDAKRTVILRFLVQQFIKENNIVITDDEVKDVVEDMSYAYDDNVEYVNWYYKDVKRIETAKVIALENKVIDKIVSLSIITEAPISYDELMHEAN